jgi:hypothetical protein
MIGKRKGVVVSRNLKEAWNKCASQCTRTGLKAYGAGRAGKGLRSPYRSKAPACRFGGCVRKAVGLTSGDLPFVPESGLRGGAVHPDRTEFRGGSQMSPAWGHRLRLSYRGSCARLVATAL